MIKSFSINQNLIIFGILALIIGVLVLLAKSPIYTSSPELLSIGITFDLLITAPLIYLLLIRKTSISNLTLVPVLIVGMIVGTLLLPPENQYYLRMFKTWVFPFIEISIISFAIFKVSQAIRLYKQNHNSAVDFHTTLKQTCHQLFPAGVVMPIVTEISVFYYGFISWKKRELKSHEYSYHKESGSVGLLIGILFLVMIETFVFHILISSWSEVAAWILTFLSVYSGFQLFGFARSMSKRPIVMKKDKLFLRYGIMNETTIELSNIRSVEVTTKDITLGKLTRSLSILGSLESHNVMIILKEPRKLIGLYGITREFQNLVLHIDRKQTFVDEITQALKQTT